MVRGKEGEAGEVRSKGSGESGAARTSSPQGPRAAVNPKLAGIRDRSTGKQGGAPALMVGPTHQPKPW